MLSWISGGAPVDDEPVARVIAAAMEEYKLAVPPPAYSSDAELKSLSVPPLVLIAAESKIHAAAMAYERARMLVPDVQAELWPGASHAINGEFSPRSMLACFGSSTRWMPWCRPRPELRLDGCARQTRTKYRAQTGGALGEELTGSSPIHPLSRVDDRSGGNR